MYNFENSSHSYADLRPALRSLTPNVQPTYDYKANHDSRSMSCPEQIRISSDEIFTHEFQSKNDSERLVTHSESNFAAVRTISTSTDEPLAYAKENIRKKPKLVSSCHEETSGFQSIRQSTSKTTFATNTFSLCDSDECPHRKQGLAMQKQAQLESQCLMKLLKESEENLQNERLLRLHKEKELDQLKKLISVADRARLVELANLTLKLFETTSSTDSSELDVTRDQASIISDKYPSVTVPTSFKTKMDDMCANVVKNTSTSCFRALIKRLIEDRFVWVSFSKDDILSKYDQEIVAAHDFVSRHEGRGDFNFSDALLQVTRLRSEARRAKPRDQQENDKVAGFNGLTQQLTFNESPADNQSRDGYFSMPPAPIGSMTQVGVGMSDPWYPAPWIGYEGMHY